MESGRVGGRQRGLVEKILGGVGGGGEVREGQECRGVEPESSENMGR